MVVKSSMPVVLVITVLVLCYLFMGSVIADTRKEGLTDLDFDNDGYITQKDLDILKSHFNERYRGYVPWDLNADLKCDCRDFYYFVERVPVNQRYRVVANISVWNMSNYTIERARAPAVILGETIYPQNPRRVVAWIKHCTSLEPPKTGSVVCVHYARDLCRLAYKELGPKTIAWGSSGVHAYGMIYTGGNWRKLSSWAIIDPYWKFYRIGDALGLHDTRTIVILLDKGRYGYWAIHLNANPENNTIYDAYKAEYRIGNYREP